MKTSKVVFLSFIIGVGAWGITAHGKSLITIRDFPTTYADASFAQRIENETAGYDVWDSVYDDNGNCISGCAYYGIRLQDELEMMSNAGAQLAVDLAAQAQQSGTAAQSGTSTGGGFSCPAGNGAQLSSGGQFIAPLKRDLVVTSVIGFRNVTGGSVVHKGIDLRADIGTPLYAAYDGEVVKVSESTAASSGGKMVKMKHTINGNTYYTRYMHMSGFNVTQGDRIQQGCLIGKTGKTGTQAAHLHYGIYLEKDGKEYAIDPLNSCIMEKTLEMIDNGSLSEDFPYENNERFKNLTQGYVFTQTFPRETSYLHKDYSIKKGLSNPVVKECQQSDLTTECKNCFPDMTGFVY